MDQKMLANLIEQPEVQRMILGDYRGSYSIGITLNPENRRELAIRVRIEGEAATSIPHHITLSGTRIPIIVSTSFIPPVALSDR